MKLNLLVIIFILLTTNALALPLKINEQALKAAAQNVNKERQTEAYKNDKNIQGIENFCKLIVQARVGKSYKLDITDRKVPIQNTENKNKYTVVGTADGEQPLNFVCKIKLTDEKKYQLEDFQIFEVINVEKNKREH
ncbi:MAG: hypothetical protein ACI4V7_04920 [Succinivibrionaceae bacterium]